MAGSDDTDRRAILVPLDGSEFAEHALDTAVRIARRQDAVLHLVRIYVPVAGVYGERAVRYDEALDRERMSRARAYLDAVSARLTEVEHVRVRAELMEGPVAQTISNHASGIGAGLIIMTTHGRGPFARFWLGSVSDEVSRLQGCPVLFVRDHPPRPDLSPERVYERVLVPLDGSALAEGVLEPLFALDEERQRRYTLLHVVRPVEFDYGPAGGAIKGFRQALEHSQELDNQEAAGARKYLDRLAEPWRSKSFTIDTGVISSERPAEAILEHAAGQKVDLIALATHGRSGLKRWMLGSVADKLLRGAETPVLLYRQQHPPAPVRG